MKSGEMCDALLNGGDKDTVKLTGDVKSLVTAMRFFKGGKMKIKGLVELDKSQYKGTNIRKLNLSDPNAVVRLFNKFTGPKSRFPIVDKERNGLAVTDGWKMLLCRIPADFPIDDAVECGFSTDISFRWSDIAEDIEPTEYALTSYRRMATIEKGGEMHGLLQAMRDAVTAYAHDDADGCLNTLRLKLGKKFYSVRGVAELTDALFKMGCDRVAFCEKTAWSCDYVCENTPLHIFGFGAAVNAKGVIMPLRYADDAMGAFVMPVEKKISDNKKVA